MTIVLWLSIQLVMGVRLVDYKHHISSQKFCLPKTFAILNHTKELVFQQVSSKGSKEYCKDLQRRPKNLARYRLTEYKVLYSMTFEFELRQNSWDRGRHCTHLTLEG